MPEQRKDPGAIWRNQPDEPTNMKLQRLINRRARDLYVTTRSEILLTILAAIFFMAVVSWRFRGTDDRMLAAGIAAGVIWLAFAAYSFRKWIARPAGHIASAGADYYRYELLRRRDHLRKAWLWHGPLFLACLFLATMRIERLWNVAPFLTLLVVWVILGVWQRRRQVRSIQQEIDEVDALRTGG